MSSAVLALSRDSTGSEDEESLVVLPPPSAQLQAAEDLDDLVGNATDDSGEIASFHEAHSGWAARQLAFPPIEPRSMPETPDPKYHFDLRQQWEGTVLRVEENDFLARLRDITNPAAPPEEAVFSKEEVSHSDLHLLAPGAIFRWSIGYRTQGGQKERVSRVFFARLPSWSKRALQRIEDEATDLQRLFSDSFPLEEST